MSRRNWTALGAITLVFAFSQLANAQGNAAPQNGNQPALNAPTNGATWQDVLEELRQLRSEVQTLQSNVSGMQQNLNAVQDGFAKQMEINDKLQAQLDGVNTGLRKLVEGGSESNFVRYVQDDSKLAGDFQKVVQGKVIFDNQTGLAQRIYINGAEWEVITGRSSMLVPYGQVTFHTRATTDGTLTQFNVDNWVKQGDQFVLNVPLQVTPTADR